MKSVCLSWLRLWQEPPKYQAMTRFFYIISDFARECGVDLSTAYTALEVASDRLFTRFFGYTAENGDQ